MSPQVEKILGYVMLAIGLMCMAYAVFSMKDVYTDLTSPPELFKMQSLTLMTIPPGSSEPVEMKIPLEPEVRKMANMFLYYLLMVFMLIAGSKVASLGIQLVKEINVKVKE
jgi:hypothetical protein